MKLVIQPARRRLAANQGHDLDVLFKLRAPAPPPTVQRMPLCIVPVVDVSGSMAGEKLESVKLALSCLVEHLAPGDRIALVTFDGEVATPIPLVEVTEARKHDLLLAIAQLRPGGSTNLSGGLVAGIQCIPAAQLAPGQRGRVLLLTDGQASEGFATDQESLVRLVNTQATGITVSAFGYGDDCDHVVLGAMADTGGGSFAHIANRDAGLTAFARELGGLIGSYAADVRLRFVPVAGSSTEERLGDLLYRGTHKFRVRVPVPAHGREGGIAIGKVIVTYRDSTGAERQVTLAVTVDHVPASEA